ncbi:MAG: DUF2461 domain-containing protein [Gemmatimonadales bacterium]
MPKTNKSKVSRGLPFRPAAFTFFRGLKRNNRKDWFEDHRQQYESEIRGPMRDLIEEVDVRLARIAPEFIGDPKRSMFRIYRDIRFSKDKSPYKTAAGVWFYHGDAGRKVGQDAEGGGAGIYFPLAPDGCFSAGGIWMPAGPVLRKVRDGLAEDPRGFERSIEGARFKRRFGSLDEEAMLKRMPRGFDEDHPAAKWLRYKSFTVHRPLTTSQVQSKRLPDTLAADVEVMLPLLRWLNSAVGYRPRTRRF